MCTGARVCVFESVPISMPMHTCSSYINSCMVYCLAVLVWVWQCNTPITFCHTLVEGLHHSHVFFSISYNTNGNQNTYIAYFVLSTSKHAWDVTSFHFSSRCQFFFPNFDELKLENDVFSNSFRNERFFQPTRTHKWCSLPFTKKKKANGTTMVEIIISLIRICLLVRRESTYVFQRHFSQYGASPVTM